jgi:hypothetical protein
MHNIFEIYIISKNRKILQVIQQKNIRSSSHHSTMISLQSCMQEARILDKLLDGKDLINNY